MQLWKNFFAIIPAMALVLPSCQSQGNPKDEAEIRKITENYSQAFNNQDVETLTGFWSEDAVLVDPDTGEELKGREFISKRYGEVFDNIGDAALELQIDTITFPNNNQAIEKGTAIMKHADGTIDKTAFRAILEKRNGKWVLGQVNEIAISDAENNGASNYENLKDLSWLIGTWADQVDDNKIEQTFEWDKNKNFIKQKFIVTANNKIDLEGEQIIGWDSNKQEIRSWIFDSDGGFGEGRWYPKDDKWIVENSYTLPDGERSTATNIYNKISDNEFSWESTNRELDGDFLPNIEPIKVKRTRG